MPAGFRTFPAMIHMSVLFTFFSAGHTDLGAFAEQVFRVFGTSRNKRRGEPADLRAINIEFDTAGEHFDVLFFQAGCSTMGAFRRTFPQCL
jgi:hypothetical protein